MSLKENIVLHIGAPKCGSSSLQAVLSRYPEFTSRGGQKFSYVAATHPGKLISGDTLRSMAQKSVFGYESTPNLVAGEKNKWLVEAARDICQQAETGTIPILSSEGWITAAKQFRETGFLKNAGLTAHAIVFVRPPLEWLNSAWWQWGVWSNANIDQFVRRNIDAARWNALVSAWESVPGVEKVTVKLASSDTVTSFFDHLDAERPEYTRTNTGLPRSLLYFFARNRAFRKDAHSPQFEFAAARQLQLSEPTPWALREDHAGYVIHHLNPPNSNLLNRLSDEDRRDVEADPKWWNYKYYKSRELTNADEYCSFEERRRLAAAMANRLLEAGNRLPKDLEHPDMWTDSISVKHSDNATAILLDQIMKLDEKLRNSKAL